MLLFLCVQLYQLGLESFLQANISSMAKKSYAH